MLTLDEVKQSLPTHLKTAATQSLTDQINQIATDPEVARNIRDNFISYTSVLLEGRFKTEDYLNAVAYVSYKLMGHTNQESYKKAFPSRYQTLVAAGRSEKEISAYVAAYNKNKLVNLIYEQTLIPAWVLNQDTYQKAINTQAELMMTAKSEKVRSDAANSILQHLKKPETKQVELNLGVSETSGMNELKDTLGKLAQMQQDAIAQGITTREIAHQPIFGSLNSSGSQIEVKVSEMKDVTPAKEQANVPENDTPHHTKAVVDDVDTETDTETKPEPETPLGPNPLTSFKPSVS